MNEHVVGEGWPGIRERHERLAEALDIIKGLLAGSLKHYRGNYFKVDHARLFDRPDRPPPITIAAGGERAARLAGRTGSGLTTTEPQADLVKAYVSTGGSGPRYAEVAMCYAKTERDAQRTAHRYFRWALAGWLSMPELPSTEAFAAASKHVSPEIVAKEISCGPSADRHLEAIGRYMDAGYDHLILVQIGPEQDAFVDFFSRNLAPQLRHREAA